MLTGSWETARMFLGLAARLPLHAETSGKNAMVITATADLDEAIADLVRSAFGHAGQKCSAASLAIVEARSTTTRGSSASWPTRCGAWWSARPGIWPRRWGR